MNILLINPFWPYPYSKGESTYNRIWPPLSLLNCATILNNSCFNAQILDCHAMRLQPHEIKKHLNGFDKIFISSSSLDKWQCPNIDIDIFLETVKIVKEVTNEFYIIGYHGTVNAENVLKSTEARAVIIGEPEFTVLELIKHDKLEQINGICFKRENQIFFTQKQDPVNLSLLPVPDYSLLNGNRYFYEILGKKYFLFEASRGCSFKCRFCNRVMYGPGLRKKSIEQIKEELKTAIENYNIKNGYFIDLDFLQSRNLAEEICSYLSRRRYRFRWACQTRVDLINKDILQKMEEAGCALIHIGIETGVSRLQASVDKEISFDIAKQAIELCKQFKIKTLIFILFGLPGETNKDRLRTLKFVKKLGADFVSFHKFYPYEGSDLSIIDSIYTEATLIDDFIKWSYLKYYLRPGYILRLEVPLILKCMKLFFGRVRTL